jgi:hypothetical protein
MERLLKAMKPVFYVSRILGFAPYSLSGNETLIVSLPVWIYSISIAVTITSLSSCVTFYTPWNIWRRT